MGVGFCVLGSRVLGLGFEVQGLDLGFFGSGSRVKGTLGTKLALDVFFFFCTRSGVP